MGEIARLIREYKETEQWLNKHREKARPKIDRLRDLEVKIWGDANWPSKIRAQRSRSA